MTGQTSISGHWASGNVYGIILDALARASKPLDALTLDDLSPIDHFHARGFPATQSLGDRLPVQPGHALLDIGCGLGGPARYFADRFDCTVQGIDLTGPFVEAANKLTALLGMADKVKVELGDGQRLPFDAASFDGAYAQHVTMNVADRARFFRSNIFVYLFDETNARKSASALSLVRDALAVGSGMISFQVIQETLNVMTRKLNPPASADDARRFMDQVLIPLWRIMPSAALFRRGLDIQSRYGYAFYDALIVSAALDAGCDRLLTEDLQHGQRIEGLVIEDPFRTAS